MSFYPKITRPTTLIDNIVTNDMNNTTVSGLLINDISDPLPVFTVYDGIYKNDNTKKREEYRRIRNEWHADSEMGQCMHEK